MPSIEETNAIKLLTELQPIVAKLNDLFSQNRMSYNAIKWDIDNYGIRKAALIEETKQIEASNAAAKLVADSIIADAKVRAAKIVDVASARNIASIRALEEVKEFAEKIEKAKYKELTAKVA